MIDVAQQHGEDDVADRLEHEIHERKWADQRQHVEAMPQQPDHAGNRESNNRVQNRGRHAESVVRARCLSGRRGVHDWPARVAVRTATAATAKPITLATWFITTGNTMRISDAWLTSSTSIASSGFLMSGANPPKVSLMKMSTSSAMTGRPEVRTIEEREVVHAAAMAS